MKNPLLVVSLVVLLCFTVSCKNKAAMAKSPINSLAEFVKDDPSAKKFLKQFPFPDNIEIVGNPQFERQQEVSPKGSQTRYTKISFTVRAAMKSRDKILVFYREAFPDKGFEVEETENGFNISWQQWSGKLIIGFEPEPEITIKAQPYLYKK